MRTSSARGDGIVVFRASDYYSDEQCNSIAKGDEKDWRQSGLRLAPDEGRSGASWRLVWRQTEARLAPVESQSRAGRGLGRKEKREARREKRETSEQREQSGACIDFLAQLCFASAPKGRAAKSRVRKTDRSNGKRETSEWRYLRRLRF